MTFHPIMQQLICVYVCPDKHFLKLKLAYSRMFFPASKMLTTNILAGARRGGISTSFTSSGRKEAATRAQ